LLKEDFLKKQQKPSCDEPLTTDEKEGEDNSKSATHSSQTFPKVSRIILDEKTGTITLKLASKKKIAETKEQEAGNTSE